MISPLLFALTLLAQDADAAQAIAAAPPEAAAETVEAAFPPGAPRDPYGLVAWCYGALSAHKGLRDQVMPEVTRIETAFRRPGSSLADDLRVYDELDELSARNLALFSRAMEAAEKASPRPINAQGADAIRRGRITWSRAEDLPKARLAQEWMSWTLPARCEATATVLEQRAALMGPAFDLTAEPEAPGAGKPDVAPEDAGADRDAVVEQTPGG
ncbi:MAG: hypothetical protein Q7S93_14670 [Phenylobacterium sp.]|uniref:hypothetical protein n=1 Tax=Phenylobacterium sp. TaxID=1871053 RepID=UPI0027235419|nr:hypothetical protein [Phenylobacterium sp.]MDO8411295.1 hypothetical protein [Phenylobacterium sp.]